MFNTSRTTRRRLAVAGALLLATAGPLAACGDDDEDAASGTDAAGEDTTSQDDAGEAAAVTVGDPWARPGTAGGNSAIYMELTGGDEDDALVGAEVSEAVATDAQVHETVMESGDMESGDMESGDMDSGDMGSDGDGSGMMSMQEVESVAIAAGETVALEPGGYHIMLLELAEDLVVGDTVEVELSFESGATQRVTAEVREP
jgi:copper(I)-binding protein